MDFWERHAKARQQRSAKIRPHKLRSKGQFVGPILSAAIPAKPPRIKAADALKLRSKPPQKGFITSRALRRSKIVAGRAGSVSGIKGQVYNPATEMAALLDAVSKSDPKTIMAFSRALDAHGRGIDPPREYEEAAQRWLDRRAYAAADQRAARRTQKETNKKFWRAARAAYRPSGAMARAIKLRDIVKRMALLLPQSRIMRLVWKIGLDAALEFLAEQAVRSLLDRAPSAPGQTFTQQDVKDADGAFNIPGYNEETPCGNKSYFPPTHFALTVNSTSSSYDEPKFDFAENCLGLQAISASKLRAHNPGTVLGGTKNAHHVHAVRQYTVGGGFRYRYLQYFWKPNTPEKWPLEYGDKYHRRPFPYAPPGVPNPVQHRPGSPSRLRVPSDPSPYARGESPPKGPPGSGVGRSDHRFKPQSNGRRKDEKANLRNQGLASAILRALEWATEVKDTQDALYESLPKCRLRAIYKALGRQPTDYEKTMYLLAHWNELNAKLATWNILREQFTDVVIGRTALPASVSQDLGLSHVGAQGRLQGGLGSKAQIDMDAEDAGLDDINIKPNALEPINHFLGKVAAELTGSEEPITSADVERLLRASDKPCKDN